MTTTNVPTTAAQLRYSLRLGTAALGRHFVDHRDAYREADRIAKATGKPVQVLDGARIDATVDPAATLALAVVTLDRAVADYRLRPGEYAALREAIASGDWVALTDETREVRGLLGDWCHRRGCHEEIHDGSPTGPLEGLHYCSRRCAEEGEA